MGGKSVEIEPDTEHLIFERERANLIDALVY